MNSFFRFYIKRAANSLSEEQYDVEQAYRNVRERLLRTRRRIYLWRGVASILLCCGLGLFVFRYGTREKQHGGTQSESNQVELILATGERISLEEQNQDIQLQESGTYFTQDTNNSIKYQVSSSSVVKKKENKMEFNQLNVPKGGEYLLTLPDGSQIWMNSESSLRFPVKFAANKREVYLSGEAYFEIAKDSTAPFVVHTGRLDVKVLGTSFNVSAYKDDDLWHVTLAEGRVLVKKEDDVQSLSPSDQYLLDCGTGEVRVKQVDVDFYSSWKNGKFYFKDYRLEDIVQKLERWYDFTFFYKQEEIKDLRFRGTINKHCPLEEVLRYIEGTTDIKFNIKDKTVVVEKIEK